MLLSNQPANANQHLGQKDKEPRGIQKQERLLREASWKREYEAGLEKNKGAEGTEKWRSYSLRRDVLKGSQLLEVKNKNQKALCSMDRRLK